MDVRLICQARCRAQKAFEKHYLSKYSGRKLQWYSALESCVLKARYPGGDKDLQACHCPRRQVAVLHGCMQTADCYGYVGLFDTLLLSNSICSLAGTRVRNSSAVHDAL
jgi:hypothetical protein